MNLNHGIFAAEELVHVYGPPSLYRVEPGNKVMLRSGGPEMTVCDASGVAPEGVATCQWLDADGTLQTDVFKVVCLTCYGAA